MIREQKQWSSSPPWCASRQYRIYSDNALRTHLPRRRREAIQIEVASKRSRAIGCLAVAEANPRAIAGEINRFRSLDLNELRGEWRRLYCEEPPRISRDIFVLALAHKEPLFRHRALAIRLRWRGPSIA